jgi:hypothetical protein
MHILAALGVIVLAGVLQAAPAKKGTMDAVDGRKTLPLTLDTARIRGLYVGGDFDRAIEDLEYARKQGQLLTHADSVFAFKHLGVMYAASYPTVEKGKQYMVLLLTIEPSVRILDMYASDMIYMIFRNIQAEMEHARSTRSLLRNATASPDTQATSTASKANPGRRSRWPYWTAGTVAVAAGIGAIAYFAFVPTEAKEPTEYKGGLK